MHKATPVRTLLLASALIAGAAQPGAALQSGANGDGRPVAELPPREGMYHAYRPGERLVYDARVGILGGVGEAVLSLHADSIDGLPVYNGQLALQASAVFGRFKVDNLLQTWFDPETMRAHRFAKRQDEPKTKTDETFDFLIDEGVWRRTDGREEGELATEYPLDDISFIYYIRALPLEVGKRYVLDDYYKESGNPVVLDVLRRETVRVPAGEFQTIVVRPTIQTSGLFSEGGEAELYLTDDVQRFLVLLKSKLPLLQTLEFRLKDFGTGY
ncbi:DUF3108 domain-containing protein [Gaopeijia maritima]|uniref:DUF3108 domain-containing protein n=1 Tax=Gaopeijia maritima TaxID=3119007 RepID=A0ABU9ED43_9BACT